MCKRIITVSQIGRRSLSLDLVALPRIIQNYPFLTDFQDQQRYQSAVTRCYRMSTGVMLCLRASRLHAGRYTSKSEQRE